MIFLFVNKTFCFQTIETFFDAKFYRLVKTPLKG